MSDVADLLADLIARGEELLELLRREPEPALPSTNALVVNERTRIVTVEGQQVDLTALEFDLLAFLARHPRQVFTRDHLLEAVWPTTWVDPATVTEHVRRIRLKIGDRWIVTVRGIGYRFQP